jgi:glucose 1-dehydrogenase
MTKKARERPGKLWKRQAAGPSWFIWTSASPRALPICINITTVHEEVPWPGAGAYAAAKGGLRNLTRALALELAEKNINVNNIAPGMVFTPMNQQAIDDPEYRRKAEQSIPMKRGAQPEERAAVFLASDDARYIHGTSLTVDGALILHTAQGA